MHLKKEELEAFQEENMDKEEWIQFLEHMSACGGCAEQIDSGTTSRHAPVYLKEEMILRVQKLDVQVPVTVKHTSKKMQLFFYGLKTAAAVLAALLMLFAIPSYDQAGNVPHKNLGKEAWNLTSELREKSSQLTERLNRFSYGLTKQNNGGNKG